MKTCRCIPACAAFVVCLIAPLTAPAQTLRPATASTGTSKVAVFRLHGPLEEAPPPFEFGFDLEPRRTLFDMLERLKRAKKDDNVKAVVFLMDQPMLGWAQMQELRQAVSDLRAADKAVYCYLEDAHPGNYLLASAASRVVMMPEGTLLLMGLHLEQVYLKGLLDKIGVQADIVHVGEYKGAGEPFTRTEPSPEAKEMLDWIVDDLYAQMIDMIAEGRQLPKEEVKAAIDGAVFTPQQAVDAKLVDELAYAEGFAKSLKERYGDDVAFDHDYGGKEGPDLDFSNIFALFKTLGEMMSKVSEPDESTIAVVYVDGMILTGKTEESFFGDSGTVGSTTIRRTLNRLRDDDNVRAVVLRVDSPGGSAVASEIIWHAVKEVADEKPVVVSMGNLAASGGYYVSVGGPTLFADPGTLTGSIGIISGKIITKGLWDWAGVSFYEMQRGKNADLFNTNRPWNEEQRAKVLGWMEAVYGTFTTRVKDSRGERLKKEVNELAAGRVYTGKQALANGLIDRLGGLHDAVRFAAEEAKLSDYKVRPYPEPKNIMDLFLKELTGQGDEDDVDVRVSAAHSWTTRSPEVARLLPMLERSDPLRFQAVLGALLRIELLSRDHTLMVLPAEILMRP